MKPSFRSDHVYAIVRYETDADATAPIENRVTVKKIVLSPEEAEAEVKRLSAVNQGKGCHYFFQVTRIEKVVLPSLADHQNLESIEEAQV